jgi:hypothetical protein
MNQIMTFLTNEMIFEYQKEQNKPAYEETITGDTFMCTQ